MESVATYKTPRVILPRPANALTLNKEFVTQTPFMNSENRSILNTDNITSNWEYREYLQKNAVAIMNHERESDVNHRQFPNFHYQNNTSDLKQNYNNRKNFTYRLVSPEIYV